MSPEHAKILTGIFHTAVTAVDPYHAVRNAVKLEQSALHVAGAIHPLENFERILVIGAGKATARMALAMETLLGPRISSGLIVVKHGHSEKLSIIEQIEAAHPVPSQAGEHGTKRILQLAQSADEKTLVICLLSGGASALLALPAEGLTLQDKQDTTTLLLKGGATINELNAVRKHLSAIKGGRLARAVYPAKMLTLIISDVIGDPLDVIASGPTVADQSTFSDAWQVIEKYQLQKSLPPRVFEHLRRGVNGTLADTVENGNICLENCQNLIIASNRMALAAAMENAKQQGFDAQIINAELQGDTRTAAHNLARNAGDALANMHSGEKRCLLSGGETTVTVRGHGQGGRNQEFALAFAEEIDGKEGIALLAAGTDGNDGPTDAAGAMVDSHTITLARQLGLNSDSHLNNNDSYGFFQQFDTASGEHTHFKPGPTGTNVMDMQIILLWKNSLP